MEALMDGEMLVLEREQLIALHIGEDCKYNELDTLA